MSIKIKLKKTKTIHSLIKLGLNLLVKTGENLYLTNESFNVIINITDLIHQNQDNLGTRQCYSVLVENNKINILPISGRRNTSLSNQLLEKTGFLNLEYDYEILYSADEQKFTKEYKWSEDSTINYENTIFHINNILDILKILNESVYLKITENNLGIVETDDFSIYSYNS